jgi:hypothetical protein
LPRSRWRWPDPEGEALWLVGEREVARGGDAVSVSPSGGAVASDPFPSPNAMQAANAELVGLVRDRLPMRYYQGEAFWGLQIAASLTRMADSVDAAMLLMDRGFDVDGQTVVRSVSLYLTNPAFFGPASGPLRSRTLRESQYDSVRGRDE